MEVWKNILLMWCERAWANLFAISSFPFRFAHTTLSMPFSFIVVAAVIVLIIIIVVALLHFHALCFAILVSASYTGTLYASDIIFDQTRVGTSFSLGFLCQHESSVARVRRSRRIEHPFGCVWVPVQIHVCAECMHVVCTCVPACVSVYMRVCVPPSDGKFL